MIVDFLLGIGAFLLIFSCFMIYRGKTDSKITISLIIAGVLLIVFSDSTIKTFHCDKEGCGFERTGLSDVNSALKADVQTINKQTEIQNKEIEKKFEKLNVAISKVNEETNTPKVALPSVAISNPQPKPDKGIVSVFFRNGQEQRAKKIVDALIVSGYKSSSTNSNLKEIEKWAKNTEDGDILVAVRGDSTDLGKNLESVIVKAINGAQVDIGTGWTFQVSTAQIYLF